jgi:hypothetical protein
MIDCIVVADTAMLCYVCCELLFALTAQQGGGGEQLVKWRGEEHMLVDQQLDRGSRGQPALVKVEDANAVSTERQ